MYFDTLKVPKHNQTETQVDWTSLTQKRCIEVLTAFVVVLTAVSNFHCFPGLLTRNTPYDFVDSTQRKRICDAIAAASIVSNCAGVDTSRTLVLGIEEFQRFLIEHQGEHKTQEEVIALIQVILKDKIASSEQILFEHIIFLQNI